MNKYLLGILRVVLLFFVIICACGFASVFAADAQKTYDAQLAEARRFTAEKSWELARNAYGEAQKLAPDAETKRWCELWHAQAEWRGSEKNWPERKKMETRLDEWESPYQSASLGSKKRDVPLPKDDFWAEIMLLRMEMTEGLRQQWAVRSEVLKYFSSMAPTKKVKERLLQFVKGFDYEKYHHGREENEKDRYAETLGRIAQAGLLEREDGAWCGLISYDLSKPDELARQRHDLEAVCKGTKIEALAEALVFVKEAKANDMNVVSNSSAANQTAWRGGYAGLLARAKTLRAQLPAKSDDIFLYNSTAKALDELIEQWSLPVLRGYMSPTIGTSDRVEFSVGAARLRNVRAELYAYDFTAYQALSELVSHDERLHDMALLKRQREVPGVRFLQSMPLFAALPKDEFAWQSDVFRFEQPLEAGFYMLALIGDYGDGETLVRTSHFTVSDIQVISMASHEMKSVDLYALTKSDGAPVANAEIQGAWFVDERRRTDHSGARIGQAWSGKTDTDGHIRAPYPEKDCEYAAIVVNGHPVVASSWWLYSRTRYGDSQKYTADLFLDRPLYRPGETVHWKLIARERKDGRFASCALSGELTVDLHDTTLVKDAALSFNAFGTTHGEFVIPANARPGNAYWSLKIGAERVGLDDSFRVDNFVPPATKAKVELTSPATSVNPGKEIEFKFNAQYYSGGGVAGVTVKCVVDVDVEREKFDAASQAAYQECRKWAGELRERHLQGTTNDNGDAEFRIKLHESLPEGTVVWIDAKAQVSGMPDLRSHLALCVSKAGVFANPKFDALPVLVGPRAENVLLFDVVNAEGKACAFEGKAVVSERRWLEIWLDKNGREVRGEALEAAKIDELKRRMKDAQGRYGIAYDFYHDGELRAPLPEGWTKIYAGYARTPVLDYKVACDTDGRLDVKFTPPHEGIFDVSIESDGKTLISQKTDLRWNGGEFRERTEDMQAGRWVFVAANAQTKALAFKPDETLIIGLEKIRNGEQPHVLLVVPENCPGAYLSISGELQVLAQRFAMPHRVGFASFEKALHASGKIEAQAFDFKNGKNLARASAVVRDERVKLSLDIVPEKTEQRPGDATAADFAAKDFAGNPVRAELAVAVTDNALLDMYGPWRSRLREPMVSQSTYPVSVEWRTAHNMRWIQNVARIADSRPGAVILARHASKFEEAEYVEAGEGMVQTDSFTQGMMPTLVNNGTVRGTLGATFGLSGMDAAKFGKSVNSDGIRLRRHFAWTAFWDPELVTDKDGRARVSFTYPDNLTQWRIAAYAVGEDGNTFGVAQAMTRTSLPLQARLLAPRFLVEGDEAALPGLFVNRTDSDLDVSTNMNGEGAVDLTTSQRQIVAPKQSEARAAWHAKARSPGKAIFTLTAKATNASDSADAMRVVLPVLEDGTRQNTAVCAQVKAGETSATMTLTLPNPLNRERLESELLLAQGRAGVMLDALPYLIDYPYGCVEQTMSRFLPAVVVKKTLENFRLSSKAVEHRIMATESRAAQSRRERSAGMQKLDDVVARSLSRLREAHQYRDGFGWWPGSRDTDLWMTAYVAWGLQLAKEARVPVSDKWLKEVRDVVQRKIIEEKTVDDRLAWALFVMSEAPIHELSLDSLAALRKTYARVYAWREKLSASGRACLLAASARWGTDAERAVLLDNLKNGVQPDAHGVHLGATSGYWRATENAVEATALTVIALLKIPRNDEVANQAVNWLVMNRRGSGWQNTRASAFALLALARYEARAGSDTQEGSAEVFLNGNKLRTVTFSKQALLTGATRLVLPAALLQSGDNRIELRRVTGNDAIYATALASAWARGDSVKAAENLLAVARDFSGARIEATLGGDGKLRATAMAETGVARAGDEVIARVTLTVPGELEYVMVEVPKPAGCEPLNPLSGWDAELVCVDMAATGEKPSRRIYREEHDDRSVFFLDHIEAGTWEIRFKMRAVTPGNFRVLPVKAEAMYAPEVRANSDARRVRIESADK